LRKILRRSAGDHGTVEISGVLTTPGDGTIIGLILAWYHGVKAPVVFIAIAYQVVA
jgi:hypothetical protein